MIVSIHQPNYFPWLGYFYKIFKSDIFVILDDVQFNKEGLQNYHYIKTPQGSLRLKIPVKANHGDLINSVKINENLDWRKKHLRTIEMNYKKANYFAPIFDDYSNLIMASYDSISDISEAAIKLICDRFGIKTRIISSTTLNVETTSTQRVVDICLSLKATEYLSGTGAKAYQNEQIFSDNGLILSYSNFVPFEYKQLWSREFQANVSILDFLMNIGYDWDFVLDNIRNGNR